MSGEQTRNKLRPLLLLLLLPHAPTCSAKADHDEFDDVVEVLSLDVEVGGHLVVVVLTHAEEESLTAAVRALQVPWRRRRAQAESDRSRWGHSERKSKGARVELPQGTTRQQNRWLWGPWLSPLPHGVALVSAWSRAAAAVACAAACQLVCCGD